MAKKKYRPQSFETPKDEHFTAIYDTMLMSEPYRKLTHSARTVYTIIKSRYRGDYTGNRIECPYKIFQQFGMNNATVSRAIVELEQRGFIDIERQGFTTGNLHRGKTIYRLSNRWYMKPP